MLNPFFLDTVSKLLSSTRKSFYGETFVQRPCGPHPPLYNFGYRVARCIKALDHWRLEILAGRKLYFPKDLRGLAINTNFSDGGLSSAELLSRTHRK